MAYFDQRLVPDVEVVVATSRLTIGDQILRRMGRKLLEVIRSNQNICFVKATAFQRP
jgi:hypothetical protein